MFKSYRKLKNLYRLNELLGSGDFSGHTAKELGREHDLIEKAQQLHASVYLSRGFINPEDINEDGRIHHGADVHQAHSYYFVVALEGKKGTQIIATIRQIEATTQKGMASFPILEKVVVHEWVEKELKGVSPSTVVEISGLAKRRGASSAAVLLLYREMWYRSLRDGHSLWLMACDTRLYERLVVLFEGAIFQIGDLAKYQGGDVIPALCRPFEVVPALLRTVAKSRLQKKVFHRKILEFLLMDYPPHLLTSEELQLIKKLKVRHYV
jgi:hypothetical protein